MKSSIFRLKSEHYLIPNPVELIFSAFDQTLTLLIVHDWYVKRLRLGARVRGGGHHADRVQAHTEYEPFFSEN